MTTFTSQIPRDLAERLGKEAKFIGEQGFYRAPSGRIIDLKPAIEWSVQGTRAYPPDAPLQVTLPGGATIIEVVNETSLSAARRQLQLGLRPAVLNFASATHPGGGFLEGARAQEEYLARSSCLYECLRSSPMYEYHRARNDPLYSDYMLYSPDVPVVRGDDHALLEEPYCVGVITAAAPNAARLPAARHGEILQAMQRRILKVLALGVHHGHDAIVLGAWGCGAFGNDARAVALLFQEALRKDFHGAYRHAVFAIVDWSEERKFIGPFESAFAA